MAPMMRIEWTDRMEMKRKKRTEGRETRGLLDYIYGRRQPLPGRIKTQKGGSNNYFYGPPEK